MTSPSETPPGTTDELHESELVKLVAQIIVGVNEDSCHYGDHIDGGVLLVRALAGQPSPADWLERHWGDISDSIGIELIRRGLV